LRRVDAHHHLWDLARRPQTWLDGPDMAAVRRDFGTGDLAAVTAAAGVDQTVLVQVLADAEETREFLALASSSEVVAAVVGWVDLTAPDVADRLHRLREGPGGGLLAGVRHLVEAEPDPAWLTRPEVLRGLREVARQGLVYDLLVRPRQMPAAIETVRALPELNFVLDHAAKPPVASGDLLPWAGLVRELAGEDNVRCKLSGLVTEADPEVWTVADLQPYAQVVLESFGPDRVMFGSDWPVCLLAAPYQAVFDAAAALTAALSPAEQDAVFGGTADRAYRLIGRRR
jgi:L-fuconolactonase